MKSAAEAAMLIKLRAWSAQVRARLRTIHPLRTSPLRPHNPLIDLRQRTCGADSPPEATQENAYATLGPPPDPPRAGAPTAEVDAAPRRGPAAPTRAEEAAVGGREQRGVPAAAEPPEAADAAGDVPSRQAWGDAPRPLHAPARRRAAPGQKIGPPGGLRLEAGALKHLGWGPGASSAEDPRVRSAGRGSDKEAHPPD